MNSSEMTGMIGVASVKTVPRADKSSAISGQCKVIGWVLTVKREDNHL